MKTNIRVRRNGGSKPAASQVPNKPEAATPQTTGADGWRECDEAFLERSRPLLDPKRVRGSTHQETLRNIGNQLWFTRFKSGSDEQCREASYGEVVAWMQKEHPEIEPVQFLRHYGVIPNQPKTNLDRVETSAQFLTRKNLFAQEQPDMEKAVYCALGLLELLGRMNSVLTPDKDYRSYQGLGFPDWADRIGKALYVDWLAANDARKSDREFNCVRRLGLTVGKVNALLLMMAHNLSGGGIYDDYELARIEGKFTGDVPAIDCSPYLTMATDCAEYLDASFYVGFGSRFPMNQFLREWIEQEIVAKFQPKEQRRAA